MSPATAPDGQTPLPAAVLWDLDGTLVDTEPSWIAAEHRLVAEHGSGRWSDEQAHRLIGFDLRESARVLQREGGVRMGVDDIVRYLLGAVIDDIRRATPWRPGARRLLEELRTNQVPCALVTMSWRALATAVVDQLPPGTFATIVSGDMVERGKPDPEPYRTAAQMLWVEPQHCVAIEDSPTGVASAMSAGCRTIAVPNIVPIERRPGLTVRRSLADIHLADLDGLFTTPRSRHPEPRTADRTRRAGAGTALDGTVRIAGRTISRRQLLVGGVGVAAVAAAAGWLLGGEELPPPPDIPIAAWVPYWRIDEATASLRGNSRMLTSVSPFWFEVNDASGVNQVVINTHANPDKTTAFIDLARQRHLRVIPSIVDQTAAGTMAATLADPAARAAHIGALLHFAEANRVDGLDIDYERFAFSDGRGTWATTRPLFSAFIAELATRLHAEGRLLTVAVPTIEGNGGDSDPGYWVYDYRELAKHADQVRIMAYDKSFDKPGPVAPMPWVADALRAAKRVSGAPSKLALGIPLYGYSWVTSTTGPCPDGTSTGRVAITQRGLADLAERRNATPEVDEDVGEASFTYTAGFPDGTPTCHQTREVHIVTAAGARARIDLARTSRLGGVCLWALGFDGPELWHEVVDLARQAASSVPATTR